MLISGWEFWIIMLSSHFFFLEHINITAETYFIFLIETLLYLLKDVPLAVIPDIIFEQEGYPAHSSLLIRTIFNRKFPNTLIDSYHCVM